MTTPAEQKIVINYSPLRRPPVHEHRWAWCMRTDGAEIQRCYDCGTER